MSKRFFNFNERRGGDLKESEYWLEINLKTFFLKLSLKRHLLLT